MDFTRSDARSDGPRWCNVCTALAWLDMLCRRAMITGEDLLRWQDDAQHGGTFVNPAKVRRENYPR